MKMSRLVAFAALLTMPAGLSAQVPEAVGVPVITVRVYQGPVPAGELRDAGRLTTEILGAAGVRVLWLDCHPGSGDPTPVPVDCGRPVGPEDLILSVVPTGRGNRFWNEQALGTALIDPVAGAGTVATIYADRVAGLARDSLTSRVDLLARAMAHEIGHLLLGTTGHAHAGLMRAAFSRDELRRHVARDWLFSRGEAMAMQHALVLRGAATRDSGLGTRD
jgi:hypothetical protein